MFIFSYLVVMILRDNHVAIPGDISLIVGGLAILEGTFYAFYFTVMIYIIIKELIRG